MSLRGHDPTLSLCYGCGVHNVQYADALQVRAREDLEKISELLK